jgi:hypothetical protein
MLKASYLIIKQAMHIDQIGGGNVSNSGNGGKGWLVSSQNQA